MKANELRIGNYLNTSEAIGITTVFHIDTDVDGWRVNYLSGKFYKPIPLTPEILDKCGFDLTQWFCEGSYKIREDRSDMLYGWTFVVRNANHDREIEFGYFKYVHELQNLYFALTGEELNINL